jgi:hypothetical protein
MTSKLPSSMLQDTSGVSGQIATINSQITTINGQITTLTNTKATDNAVVHLSGNESIAGIKTFTSQPIFPQSPTYLGTVATNAGQTAVDYLNIPSTVRKITIPLYAFSTSGTALRGVRLGSGTFQITGYQDAVIHYQSFSSGNYVNDITLFPFPSNGAVDVIYGLMTLFHMGSNLWVMSFSGAILSGGAYLGCTGGGSVQLSGVLDRIRITTYNGTDTFDSGSVGLYYE